MTLTDEIMSKLGIPPRNLTYRESENRRVYESNVMQSAIGAGIPVSDSHTHTTYNKINLPPDASMYKCGEKVFYHAIRSRPIPCIVVGCGRDHYGMLQVRIMVTARKHPHYSRGYETTVSGSFVSYRTQANYDPTIKRVD